jgi:DNA adenine methylase
VTTLTLPLKWHGGKKYLAKRIVALMPRHMHYVEPFAGGLAVLLARDPNDKKLWVSERADRSGVSELVNDLNKDLTNFWRVLQGNESFASFKRLCDTTSLSRVEFNAANQQLQECPEPDPATDAVTRAWQFFICCRQSRAGTFRSFTSLTRSRTRRGINGNASEWLGCIEGLPAVHARLRPVVIENTDALQLIPREDTEDTLFYLDPPYLHETRETTDAYAHEMTYAQHSLLLQTLAGLRGKFILSGYRSDLYDREANAFGWRREEFDMPNHAAGGDSKRRMVECVWLNY